MKIEQICRREFVGGAAAFIAAFSGCSGISNALSGRKMRSQWDLSGNSDNQYVEGQPTFESVPAAEGWLVTDPEWMDTNIRWDQLKGEKTSLRGMQGKLDSEKFLTVIVGALPYKYGLGNFGDSSIEGQTVHINTKATKVITGGKNPNDPEHTFYYEFILWRLLNDTEQPTEMDLNASFGALPTETRTETTE